MGFGAVRWNFLAGGSGLQILLQRVGVVADDIEADTLCGAVWSEGADDDVAAGLDCVGEQADVGGAVAGDGEEVKDGAVVPDVVCGGCEFGFGDVGDEPVDAV
jgi:hypothetical protein